MTTVCANCGSALAGRFCNGCGQDARQRITFSELAGQAIGGLFNLDSRFWRTLRDLAVPGRMTAEYLAGRRVRYLPPVQTYLVVALLFFAIVPAGFEAFVVNMMVRDDITRAAAEAGVSPQVQAERWLATYGLDNGKTDFQRKLNLYSWLMFITMPVFALLLHGVHLARRRDFLDHLVFAIQLQTAAFALAALALAIEMLALRFWLPPPTVVLWPTLSLVLGAYGVFAVRRVYGEHLAVAALKLGAVGLANLALLIVAARVVTLLTDPAVG